MLSERIETLYRLLQCGNTAIAYYAGCTPSNLSRLKSGTRTPEPQSATVARFAQGVYGYADYENMLPALCELCGAADSSRESLIPALIAWLYGRQSAAPPPRAAVPRSKRALVLRRMSFGARLDRAMTLLGLSNSQLAAALRVDSTLISRYRLGRHSPHRNAQLAELLVSELLARAEKSGATAALAALCEAPADRLDADALARWLYTAPEEADGALARSLLHSLDGFAPEQGVPAAAPEAGGDVRERYEGTDGLRRAVIRFLSDAAREGGELLLYSDEPMDWMTGDRQYFARWASLMAACVQNGVRIKIIHNVARDMREMADAVRGWYPLYISGRIEPYVFSGAREARFCHTLFLRVGGACIEGFFPVGARERLYRYVTDAEGLDVLRRGFAAMLSAASPFLKTYPAAMRGAYHELLRGSAGRRQYLLFAFPAFTMPERLLTRVLSRAAPEAERAVALALCREQRRRFLELLRTERVEMLFCLPAAGAALGRVNFALDLLELSADYTREEYAAHLAAIVELVEREPNFHLTLLPDAPYRDIQLVTFSNCVSVSRCREPYAAFVFTNPTLSRSVSAYFASLIEEHVSDRREMAAALRRLMEG